MKLLLAEDTRDLNRALTAMLTMQSYEVDSVFDGVEAMEALSRSDYDGVILDIMMPRKDGLSVLSDMRAMGISTPVLMLTAKAEVEDRVSGLDAGADDYLTKPFAMKELIARVRALTRRQPPRSRPVPTVLRYADLTLNTEALELASESSVRLSMKESELMAFFLQNPERPFSTADLFSRIWPDEPGMSEDVVYLYVSYLRTKLRAIASSVSILGSRGGEYACRKE